MFLRMKETKNLVENMLCKLGGFLKIKKSAHKVKALRDAFCYVGYCRKYPRSDYSYYDYLSYDYSKGLVKSAMETGVTWGILKTLTEIMSYVKDEDLENVQFNLLQEKIEADLKKYVGWKQDYLNACDELVNRFKEGPHSWGK
jgi:hypothetical protein